MKPTKLLALLLAVLPSQIANAQVPPSYTYDPDSYYSQTDRDGYFDQTGHYHFYRDYSGPAPSYYRRGDYERGCKSGRIAGATIFGTVSGGILVAGFVGEQIASDINCEDRAEAFSVYYDALNGDIGRRYEWRHAHSFGDFVPTREYLSHGYRCRDFTASSHVGGQKYNRFGTACRFNDGTWHFR